MALAWDTPGVISAGTRLSVVAPIDSGNDAQTVAARLLRAGPCMLEHCTDVHTFDLTWNAPGALTNRRVFEQKDRRAFRRHFAAYRPGITLAASYCALGRCRGFCLWQDIGAIWTCWTPQGREFDAWLRTTMPEFRCEAEAPTWESGRCEAISRMTPSRI